MKKRKVIAVVVVLGIILLAVAAGWTLGRARLAAANIMITTHMTTRALKYVHEGNTNEAICHLDKWLDGQVSTYHYWQPFLWHPKDRKHVQRAFAAAALRRQAHPRQIDRSGVEILRSIASPQLRQKLADAEPLLTQMYSAIDKTLEESLAEWSNNPNHRVEATK